MYKINETVDKYLLAGDKLMPEMHLKQSGFIHCASGPFIKNKERIEKCMQTGDTDYIYKNDLKLFFNMILLMLSINLD